MDISAMLVGKSDQLDNVDLLSGPRVFTITGASKGLARQRTPRPCACTGGARHEHPGHSQL